MRSLEDVLIEEGVAADRGTLRAVLQEAAEQGRSPVVALVERGLVTEDLLSEILARAAGTLTVDLDAVAVFVPEELRRLAEVELFVFVAEEGRRPRVAFANPLSPRARGAVERSLGEEPIVVVATLRAARRALTRAERPLAPEITRRIDPSPPMDTAPLVRLEDSATDGQRVEALLLALIEKGVLTRADYIAALQRLLKR